MHFLYFIFLDIEDCFAVVVFMLLFFLHISQGGFFCVCVCVFFKSFFAFFLP